MALNRCGNQLELHDCRSVDASRLQVPFGPLTVPLKTPMWHWFWSLHKRQQNVYLECIRHRWKYGWTICRRRDVSTKIKYDATGWLKADFSNNLFHTTGRSLPESEDDYITIETYLPIIVRTGVLFRPRTDFEVKMSAVYEGWSSMQSLDIKIWIWRLRWRHRKRWDYRWHLSTPILRRLLCSARLGLGHLESLEHSSRLYV